MREESIDTVIGDDISFRGSLVYSNTLKINGNFKGTIQTTGKLIVGETGSLEADIEVGVLVVEGKVKGNVNAKEKIELKKPSELIGDIKSPNLEVESGSKFLGNCSM
ncbi:MAG: polymer-forming cytoskeletal protein [Leptospiraceae bacterium]|jgi:cytoskeletal protein CcmA (bactofilin family)|nr:polymer-forming cytoskeletal protein [Leptospiraceae bacterium]MCZ8237132.1 polymer-forming cytoskeletal protein [Leptospiraceae bacterium]MCZ8348162.1 polymer-forming cytoskeletal protein [Leptospiraceae bacterium]PJE01430.1 MAG: cell division protein [Leptospira sp.]